MKSETDFEAAYERLSIDGKCDLPGGTEYERVFHEWISCGCPNDIEEFICKRANWAAYFGLKGLGELIKEMKKEKQNAGAS